MEYWILLVAVALLWVSLLREHFTDPEECKTTGVDRSGKACTPKIVPPSSESSIWKSKVEAEIPIGQSEKDYMPPLQAFYNKVYVPATTRPTEAQVDAFLTTADAAVPGVAVPALKRIIMSGFRLESGMTAAAREEKQTVKTGALVGFAGKELAPKMGIDEVRVRTEIPYTPADERTGELPEGIYEPTKQQEEPRRGGEWDDKSISWNRLQFFGF